MNEVLRRWNAPNNRLRAEVAFLILKDGSVARHSIPQAIRQLQLRPRGAGRHRGGRQRQGVRSAARWVGRQRASRDASSSSRVSDPARRSPLALLALAAAAVPAAAQDSVPQPGGVRLTLRLRSRQPPVAGDRARRGPRFGAHHHQARPRFQRPFRDDHPARGRGRGGRTVGPAELRAVQEFRRRLRARAGAVAPARPRCACTT